MPRQRRGPRCNRFSPHVRSGDSRPIARADHVRPSAPTCGLSHGALLRPSSRRPNISRVKDVFQYSGKPRAFMYFGPGIISVPRETYQSKSMSLRGRVPHTEGSFQRRPALHSEGSRGKCNLFSFSVFFLSFAGSDDCGGAKLMRTSRADCTNSASDRDADGYRTDSPRRTLSDDGRTTVVVASQFGAAV
jgi:hypothetical protein